MTRALTSKVEGILLNNEIKGHKGDAREAFGRICNTNTPMSMSDPKPYGRYTVFPPSSGLPFGV